MSWEWNGMEVHGDEVWFIYKTMNGEVYHLEDVTHGSHIKLWTKNYSKTLTFENERDVVAIKEKYFLPTENAQIGRSTYS